MRNWLPERKYIVFVVGTSIGAALLFGPVARFVSVDTCLDRGGRWNYELGGCEAARGQLEPLAAPQGLDPFSVAVAVVGAIPVGLVAMVLFGLVHYVRERWLTGREDG